VTVKALLIRPFEAGELIEQDPELEELQRVVGGYIEGIGPREMPFGWHAYCDDEGKLKGLPINQVATALALNLGWPHGDVLCGPVLFLGNDEEGDEADVPDIVVRVWVRALLDQSD
jgi:hypothetical protein